MTGTYALDYAASGPDFAKMLGFLAALGLCPHRYGRYSNIVEVWVPRSTFADGTHEIVAYDHYTFPGELLKGCS